jgi:hypothetical protein
MFDLNKHYKIILLIIVSLIALYIIIARIVEYKLAQIESRTTEINAEMQMIDVEYRIRKQHN